MISLANAFGALSAADLMKLFAQVPSNSADSAGTSAAPSTMTGLSTTPGISTPAADASARTIYAILAQAEIDRAPIAGSLNSGLSVRVAAAYAGETGGSGPATNATSTYAAGAVDALSGQINDEVRRMSLAGMDSRVSDQAWTSGSSLAISTADGMTVTATGNRSMEAAYQEEGAVDTYRTALGDLSYQRAQAGGAISDIDAATDSAATGTATSSRYLQLTIHLGSAYGENENADAVEQKAQDLLAQYKSGTIAPGVSNINGFGYSERSDNGEFTISAIEVQGNLVGVYDKPLQGQDASGTQPFSGLYGQSLASSEVGLAYFKFAIPL